MEFVLIGLGFLIFSTVFLLASLLTDIIKYKDWCLIVLLFTMMGLGSVLLYGFIEVWGIVNNG